MRTAITIGIHHGGEITELLEGVTTSIEEQRKRFKAARAAETHDRFERIELWESGTGCSVIHRFREPKPAESKPTIPPPPPGPTEGDPSEPGEGQTSDEGEPTSEGGEPPAESDEFKLSKPGKPAKAKRAAR